MSQNLVKRVITASEVGYGFIRLPKETQVEPFVEVTLLIDGRRESFKVPASEVSP
jgi:hypothetical protein